MAIAFVLPPPCPSLLIWISLLLANRSEHRWHSSMTNWLSVCQKLSVQLRSGGNNRQVAEISLLRPLRKNLNIDTSCHHV